MALKSPDRYQTSYLPESIEDYVSQDDPVRAYDAMIDAIGHEELGLEKQWKKVGNSPYDPMSMMKLLVFAYSYGWKSSRKIERALYHNLAFIWLVGGLKPDHKTIAEFRRKHLDTLKELLKKTVRICIDLKLIAGNVLFLDGSKIRGNASINQTKTIETLEKRLEHIDTDIDTLLCEIEVADQEEEGSESYVKMQQELCNAQALKEKVQAAVEKGKKEKQSKVNLTDCDAVDFKSRQGSHTGFNTQAVADEKNGLLVHVDVVKQNNDHNQFAHQINQANENLPKPCESAVADSGYFVVDDLKEIADQGIDVIVPSKKQASDKEITPFDKENFQYNEETNEYVCPEGKILYFSYLSKTRNQYKYRMKREADCRECPHFGECTTAKRGRNLTRLVNEELKNKLEARYVSEEAQDIYKKRKERIEHPFGHIKRNLGCSSFLMRGLEAAKGEVSLYASCFNISRLFTLLGGTQKMIKKLAEITK
jgi:transposase